VTVGVRYFPRCSLRIQLKNSNLYPERGDFRFTRNSCTSVPNDRTSHIIRPSFQIIIYALTFLLTPFPSSTFDTLLQHRSTARKNPSWSLNKVHFAACSCVSKAVHERCKLPYCWLILTVQIHSFTEAASL